MKEQRKGNRRPLTLSIAPSKRRILEMGNKTLIANYALILHKASSLSSTQRRMVKELVEYRIGKGSIKTEDVAKEVASISQMIKDRLEKALEDENSTNI